MQNKKINTKKLHFKFKYANTFNKHILKFGKFGFKINKTICLDSTKEEFLQLFILKNLKNISLKKTKIFFSFACFYTKTKLPLESRMGKGKGEIINLFGYYKKGFILMELLQISSFNIYKLFTQLNKKKILKLSLIK
uniref:Ribosomal protein L16 n=1 Tax=Dipterosiphonia australica TaxID=2007208 RepID=UPI0022FDAD99|nr:Ribosomal protein L16 [Dipterosiphonia australica]WAX04226.1 Ribosomal protein L16 [Dipterosiphonia australica]